jgi:hypothetical protein
MVADMIFGDIMWLFFVVLGLACVAGPIGTAISAAQYPGWAFQRAETNKAFWIAVPIVLIFACGPVGLGLSIAWFRTYRGRVELESTPAPNA